MNFVIVGASAGLGRALSEELAEKGHNLLLISGDERDLQIQASDLQIRYGTQISTLACRLKSDEATIESIEKSAEELGTVDGLLFPLGLSRDNDDGMQSPQYVHELLEANLSGTMALTGRILPRMLKRNSGYIVGFGSVAADRGRGSNIVYAAAKRGLSSFFESIRHKAAGSGVKIHFYQMGYLETSLTFGKKLPFPAASPKQAAREVVRHLETDRGLTYFPFFWRWICLALRMTPWSVFKKLRF